MRSHSGHTHLSRSFACLGAYYLKTVGHDTTVPPPNPISLRLSRRRTTSSLLPSRSPQPIIMTHHWWGKTLSPRDHSRPRWMHGMPPARLALRRKNLQALRRRRAWTRWTRQWKKQRRRSRRPCRLPASPCSRDEARKKVGWGHVYDSGFILL